MPDDLADQVGQDKPYKDGADAYDAKHGKYVDGAEGLSSDQLPNGGPLPAQPNPFKLGPLG